MVRIQIEPSDKNYFITVRDICTQEILEQYGPYKDARHAINDASGMINQIRGNENCG